MRVKETIQVLILGLSLFTKEEIKNTVVISVVLTKSLGCLLAYFILPSTFLLALFNLLLVLAAFIFWKQPDHWFWIDFSHFGWRILWLFSLGFSIVMSRDYISKQLKKI